MIRIFIACCVLILAFEMQAQICNSSGNVVVFTNYDGGVININCDVNIPNLKIGICTYEDVDINIIGPFASSVTEVLYAGYQGDNDNCNQGVSSTTISGVGAGVGTVLFAPPGVLTDSNGYPSIICAYSCDQGNQGGCNTAAQIVAYFMSEFGGTLRTYQTQYGCWENDTYNVSSSNCCTVPTPGVEAFFTISDPLVCVGQCIDFTDGSSQSPTSWNWSFQGAGVSTSSSQNPTDICFETPGVHAVTLTAANGNGNDSYTAYVEVFPCGIPGCTYSNATNYNPSATMDDQSCIFPPCSNSCPGDLNNDTLISVADLIIFISMYGSTCP